MDFNNLANLTQQYQQAYLVCCYKIMQQLQLLAWLIEQQKVEEQAKNEQVKPKSASGVKKISQDSNQQTSTFKPLKHKEKPNFKTGLASESLYYQKDEDTGLYYANARYYDSNTGRFNREDPFEGDQQTPPSLHRYLYAYANPTIYYDPDGKQTIGLDIHTRIRDLEDVDRIVNESNERVSSREKTKEKRSYFKFLADNEARQVAESSNNELLLKRNIDINEVINRAHMSSCVYQSAKNCGSIWTSNSYRDNIRRLNDKEYKKFEINRNDLIDSTTGFKSDVFINEDTGDITMAFAGTDDVPDTIIDILQFLTVADQYTTAAILGQKLSNRAGELGVKLSFTGHSLGGGLASFASLLTGREATTFNSAGLGYSNTLLAQILFRNFEKQDNLIDALYVQGEVVSKIQDSSPLSGLFGAASGRRIELTRGSTDNFIEQHFMTNVCLSLGEGCNYAPEK